MYIRVIGSGSNGNCTILKMDDSEEYLMCDCGASNVSKEIRDITIAGILITHCHTDHCSKLKYISDKIPIYGAKEELTDERVARNYDYVTRVPNNKYVTAWERFDIGSYNILAIPAYHDTPNPFHFIITNGKETFFYGCDCSEYPPYMDSWFDLCDTIMVECDYDELAMSTDMIDGRPVDYVYDADLKARVKVTHASSKYIGARMSKYFDTKHVILGHLSKTYNSKKTTSRVIPNGVIVDREDCPITINFL